MVIDKNYWNDIFGKVRVSNISHRRPKSTPIRLRQE